MNSTQISKVPHLTTSLQGPLAQLEHDLLNAQADIEAWMRQQWRQSTPSFYSSVDLRNSGYKIAPVDTNLFPAGFNNLNPEFMSLCVQAAQATIDRYYPDVRDVMLVPENHSRNMHYFENLVVIQNILQKAGYNVRIGSVMPDLTAPREVALPSGQALILEPIMRQGDRLQLSGFVPQLVVLNNDLSDGVPTLLQNIEQQVVPPAELGWSTRLKSSHFQQVQNVVTEFSNEFSFDPWTMSPLFSYCGELDFMSREGENCLVRHAERIFKGIEAKYKEYNINDEPFVVVKSDAGTYGMAVMMVKDPEELRQLNRKQRTKMASAKGGQHVSRAIVQEGVYTYETWGKDNAVTEPVVYMIGGHVVGGFYRVHQGRGANENLNAPGMNFEPLAFVDAGSCPGQSEETNRFYSYGVVARLAALAAAREVQEVLV